MGVAKRSASALVVRSSLASILTFSSLSWRTFMNKILNGQDRVSVGSCRRLLMFYEVDEVESMWVSAANIDDVLELSSEVTVDVSRHQNAIAPTRTQPTNCCCPKHSKSKKHKDVLLRCSYFDPIYRYAPGGR